MLRGSWGSLGERYHKHPKVNVRSMVKPRGGLQRAKLSWQYHQDSAKDMSFEDRLPPYMLNVEPCSLSTCW